MNLNPSGSGNLPDGEERGVSYLDEYSALVNIDSEKTYQEESSLAEAPSATLREIQWSPLVGCGMVDHQQRPKLFEVLDMPKSSFQKREKVHKLLADWVTSRW